MTRVTPLVWTRMLGETDLSYAAFCEVCTICRNGSASTIAAAMKLVAAAHEMPEVPDEWVQWSKRFLWKQRVQRVVGAFDNVSDQTLAYRAEIDEQAQSAAAVNLGVLSVTGRILASIDEHLLTGSVLPDRALISILPSLVQASLKLQDKRLDLLKERRTDTASVELAL
jgi:hypothetical protein